VILVVCGLELDIHQVDGGIGCSQEYYLHHRVVQGNICGDEIEVPCRVDKGEKQLALATDA
jgi:hypothetical protein